MIYLDEPPATVTCLYCGNDCLKIMLHKKADYNCHNHGDTKIIFQYVKFQMEDPSWFFNSIKITRGKWRLLCNVYDTGQWVWMERLVPDENIKRGWYWTLVASTPTVLILSPIEVISSYLNLYRVFS